MYRALLAGVAGLSVAVAPWGAVPDRPVGPVVGPSGSPPVLESVVQRLGPSPAAAVPARVRAAEALRVRAGHAARVSRAARMEKVTRFARAQVGDRYRYGATGPDAFDCSGLTQAAYRKAGIRLPHSSRQQAARARSIPRSQARPGDLVVGPGHVGIYMGGGKMVDAGNRRVGVVYRKVYSGLRIKRLG